MAKFMFLICILVALVHENVSESSAGSEVGRAKLDACVADKKKLQILIEDPSDYPSFRSILICFMEKYKILNDDRTVNNENSSRMVTRAFDDSDGSSEDRLSHVRNCTSSAAAAKPNDTILNVYAVSSKCIVRSGMTWDMKFRNVVKDFE